VGRNGIRGEGGRFIMLLRNAGIIVGADLRVCPNLKNRTTQEGEHIGSPLHEIIQWFKTMTTKMDG
jgi:hypothetical protein